MINGGYPNFPTYGIEARTEAGWRAVPVTWDFRDRDDALRALLGMLGGVRQARLVRSYRGTVQYELFQTRGVER